MGPDRYASRALKDIHKDCLRLAGRHYSSKEIGRMLGISKHTVDQRLRHATVIMGASSRFDAARRFCDFEALVAEPKTYDPIVYDTPDIPHVAACASAKVSAGERDRPGDSEGSILRDAQAPYFLGDASRIEALLSIPVSTGEEPHTSLGWRTKVLLVVGFAVISLLAFAAAIAALEVLSRI